MAEKGNTLKTFILAGFLAAALFGVVHFTSSTQRALAPASAAARSAQPVDGGTAVAAQPAPAPVAQWAASAPGRVEPRGGEIRIGAQAAGRIVEIIANANDRVHVGDLLMRLDDEDARAKVSAAEAEAAARKRDRDAETVGRQATDRRQAEDNVAAAERALVQTRHEQDRVLRLVRQGKAPEGDLGKARSETDAAHQKLVDERDAFRRVQAQAGMPLPTRLEAGLIAARADLSAGDAALERTRIRAPSDGTILQSMARLGETVVPSPENVLFVMGDLSQLRVRAELEERDVGKVRVGQRTVIKADAFPGRQFEGKVASLAKGLGPGKASQKGPRKPTDIDVLEIMIDLDGETPLLTGLRVDVFFRSDANPSPVAAATAK